MQTKALAATIAALTLAVAPAHAHHPGAVGNTSASGPINTLAASTLGEGMFVAGMQIEQTNLDTLSDALLENAAVDAFLAGDDVHFHSVETIRTIALSLGYGITDDLTLSLRIPFVARDNIREGHAHDLPPVTGEVHRLGDATGIGDITVLGQLRVLKDEGLELAALFGVELPTGETGEHNAEDGNLFDTEFQPGSDSWDVLFGVAATKRVARWSFDASALYTIAGDASSDLSLSIATLAPTMPIIRRGLRCLSSSAVRTSWRNDGVEVWMTTRSRSSASCLMSSQLRSCAGASISLEPSTIAAGCASQVGYQKERTSRFIW